MHHYSKTMGMFGNDKAAFKHPASGFMAPQATEYGLDYFLKGALAGGICCSVTHGALTPVAWLYT